jgi:hypothetical protein
MKSSHLSYLKDFLTFKKMITPIIIQAIFWLLLIIIVASGIITIFHKQIITGILMIILSPFAVRVMCEWFIVLFSINASVAEIRDLVKKC